MRMLLKVQVPNERGGQLVREGKLGSTIQAILGEIKPEAVYFLAQASDIPRLAEPFFLGLGAKVEIQPCMVPADLAKAEPDLQRAAQTYGR